MTELRVLQEASHHRAKPGAREQGRRSHRLLRTAVLAAVVCLVSLLAFMAPRAAGPTVSRLTQLVGPGTATAAHRIAPPAIPYGRRPVPPAQRVTTPFKFRLTSGLEFNVATGQALWQVAPDDVVPIASLTKMMTALVVVTHARPDAQVFITRDALNYTGSGIGLLPLHKHVLLLTLLYGLLLPSGNDAAIALADYVAGTQDRFIAMMNAQAHQMGLHCTHFTTVSGIVDQGNHSCAYDLAILTHALLQQPLLAKIVASRSAILPFPIKGGKLYLYNNNPLELLRYPGIDGVKTGYTDASGRCLIATARRGKAWLGVVLLHSNDTYDQARFLLDAGFRKLLAPGGAA